MNKSLRPSILIFFICITPVFIWSGLGAKRIDLWYAETLPLLFAYFIMVKSFKAFPLTNFSYLIVFTGSTLMLIGAYYSYSLVPLFESIKELFGFERNHYDKLIHFFQGLTVTVLTREIISRKAPCIYLDWINVFSLISAAAIAAIWEIIEWLYVLIVTYQGVIEPSTGFLGEQNYYWDSQSDMFFAIIGSLVAVLSLAKYHDKKIKQIIHDSV